MLITNDSKIIGRDWTTAFAPVRALAESWQSAADAILVLALIDEFEISTKDLKNLARVLYYSPDPASQQRALDAVTYLLRHEMATSDAEGTLRPVRGNDGPTAGEQERIRRVR